MANELLDAMRRLHVSASPNPSEDDKLIDDFLMVPRPRKRAKPTREELKQKLDKDFLRPSPTFSTHWLNKLQQ